jgi:polysaccharide pyruvyl transferase WcaK-like protein
MKYTWTSITKDCINKGNFLIEKALKDTLKKQGFNEPSFEFSSFKIDNLVQTLEQIEQTDFIIVPGCTTLSINDYPGLKEIMKKTSKPIFNIGPAFFKHPDETFLDISKNVFKPLGVRDPFSFEFLQKHGIDSQLIGCPTLLLGSATKFENRDNKKILFCFGLENIDEQIKLIQNLINLEFDITIVIQAKYQLDYIQNIKAKTVDYSPESLLHELSDTRLVVTGRLHVALPAVAIGTPVFFIETINDCRFSLIDFLGIKKFKADDKKLLSYCLNQLDNFEYNNETFVYNQVQELRKRFIEYIQLIQKQIN